MSTLKEAIIEKEQFLKDHPHLYEFQKELDNILGNCSNLEERMNVLSLLALDRFKLLEKIKNAMNI